MLLRAGVALAMLGAVFGGVAHAEASARASCEASLTAARDWAARLDSALEKLRVRVDGKRTLVAGAECNRLELEVRPDARGRADKPWRAEKVVRKVSLLLDGGATLCGERRVEERAHGGFVASLVTRAVPVAIIERFKRAVDDCVSGGAKPKSAPRPDRRAARP